MSGRPSLTSRARAGGKVILIGEHAVVHGHPAIAAAVQQGITLEARPTGDARQPITVEIPAWDLALRLTADTSHPVARACLEVLTYCDGPVLGWEIHGTSDLPARAGLGSSAALTVAMARLALGDTASNDDVVEASLAGETVFHGAPSGIDSHVAATGGMLRYIKGQRPTPVPIGCEWTLVVGQSGLPRQTAEQVAKVGRRLTKWPIATRWILDALGALTDEAQACLARADQASLGEVFDAAHHLLASVGVSNQTLDHLCHTARQAGACGAKLTGAGGGGSIIALVPDRTTGDRVVSALEQTGATAFVTTLAPT